MANWLARFTGSAKHPAELPAPPPWRSFQQYETWVQHLIAAHPLDEAMRIAVGGRFEAVGAIERDILVWAGLRDDTTLVDIGCGSGRLPAALQKTMRIDYTGLDAVEALVAYARTLCPTYTFVRNVEMALPIGDEAADMVSAFAVFPHMLHSETYIYLADIRRVLKPGGCLVMSFTEFAEPSHWANFMAEVNSHKTSLALHISIERPVIDVWCEHLGLVRETFAGALEAPWGGAPLGQSIAVLRKPAR